MATFAKATFDSARYAAARPTYPRQLFDAVFQYHARSPAAQWHTAVDLGCGTGQATTELRAFKHVIGVDPSANMVAQARAAVAASNANANANASASDATHFEFVQAPAEDLSFLKDGSVDLLVAAQAAHWFDWSKIWPEAARVLRTGGSVAFWGYSEFRLRDYPSLTPLISQFTQGPDPATSLGPHWQQPGRAVLDNHFLDVPVPTAVLPDHFTAWEHVFYTGPHHPHLPAPRPVLLHKRAPWPALLAYLHTASALHTFRERYPADATRADGDLAARFVRALRERVRELEIGRGRARAGGVEGKAEAEAEVEAEAGPGLQPERESGKEKEQEQEQEQEDGDEDAIDIEWPLALMLVKRA